MAFAHASLLIVRVLFRVNVTSLVKENAAVASWPVHADLDFGSEELCLCTANPTVDWLVLAATE